MVGNSLILSRYASKIILPVGDSVLLLSTYIPNIFLLWLLFVDISILHPLKIIVFVTFVIYQHVF